MHLELIRSWFTRVYGTLDYELDCSDLLDIIPQYVDMEVAGNIPEKEYPQVKHHLAQCTDCYDMYLTLRDVASLEQQHIKSELADIQQP
jgi:hypothetical protein